MRVHERPGSSPRRLRKVHASWLLPKGFRLSFRQNLSFLVLASMMSGLFSCKRTPANLEDVLGGANGLQAGEAAALREWLSANGLAAGGFVVIDGPGEEGRLNAVGVVNGSVATLSADGAKTLRGLEKLTGLKHLELAHYHGDELAGCPASLVRLKITNTTLRSLSALGSCVRLHSLRLYDTALDGLGTLPELAELHDLAATGHEWNAVALPLLPELLTLNLSHNHLRSVEGLDRLPRLTEMLLEGNQLAGLDGIAGLSGLRQINLRVNRIRDTGEIAANANVDWLNLEQNPLDDLSSLRDWTGLKTIRLDATPVAMATLPPALLAMVKRVRPSGHQGREQTARELMRRYLENAHFVEKPPPETRGHLRGVRSELQVSTSRGLSGSRIEVSGRLGVGSLEGRALLPVVKQVDVILAAHEVVVHGKASVSSAPVVIYSPVQVDFWQQAALLVDQPGPHEPAPGDLRLDGYLAITIRPGEPPKPFQANLVNMGTDKSLLVHAPEGGVTDLEIEFHQK